MVRSQAKDQKGLTEQMPYKLIFDELETVRLKRKEKDALEVDKTCKETVSYGQGSDV